MTGFRLEKLARRHVVDSFDCGEEPLNRFLIRYALPNSQANASQTYVGLSGDDVIGFYILVVGEVAYEDAPDRIKKGLARHPVPIMLLARLAVSLDWQGKGVGAGLLRDPVLPHAASCRHRRHPRLHRPCKGRQCAQLLQPFRLRRIPHRSAAPVRPDPRPPRALMSPSWSGPRTVHSKMSPP